MELLLIFFYKFLSSLDKIVDRIFLNVLDMTFTVSIVILAVLGIRLLLQKAPKIFSYTLWSAVLIRLLCPFSFETPIGVFSQSNTIANSYTLANKPISFLGSMEAVYQATGDVLNGGIGIQHIRLTELDTLGNTTYVTSEWWEVWILFGKYIWIAGIVILLIYNLLSLRQLHRKLIGAVPLSQNIYESDYIDFPFTLGLFFPKIYLPSSLSHTDQTCIIEHEQHHIKRGDHVIKFLAFLALCLHWFNPLVWIVFFLATKDLEMSCDEAVVRKECTNTNDFRAQYATSILNLSVGKEKRRVLATVLSFIEGNPKERVKNVMNQKKTNRWIVVLCSSIVALAIIILITNPLSNKSTTVEDGIYQIEDIIYNIYDDTELPINPQSQFRVTKHYELYRKDSSSETWEYLGTLESYPLTKSELNDYIFNGGWTTSYQLKKITDAYTLRVENDMFYYMMQTQNGDTLLSYGWEDAGSERYDAFSDDTVVTLIFRLNK